MKALLTGAGGVLGGRLAEGLQTRGIAVIHSGRTARSPEWLAWDMRRKPHGFHERFDYVVHAAPIWLLPAWIQDLADNGAGRVVCYSSTSILTKQMSVSRSERELARTLEEAEANVRAESDRLGVATTIFRPTMTYGYGRDRNITAIAGFIRRYGFFPVAGDAAGKRQPVHVNDAAGAAVSALDCARACGRTYNLAGGETLSYRTMVGRIFESMHSPERIISVPVAGYRLVLRMARLLGAQVTASMADRMNRDLVFDTDEARADFAFAPEGFLEQPERDLPAA